MEISRSIRACSLTSRTSRSRCVARGSRFSNPRVVSPEPEIWIATERVSGVDVAIPVDLIVLEAASGGVGRRGARLGIHGTRAARRAVGLEAVLVDHSPMTIGSLDPADAREVTVELEGKAALVVAKAHTIHDRLASGSSDRLADKDAADICRIMQTTRPDDLRITLRTLRDDSVSGSATVTAMSYMRELFGRRTATGVVMAQRALVTAVDESEIATLCVTFTNRLQ
jgi:hypothetical protein